MTSAALAPLSYIAKATHKHRVLNDPRANLSYKERIREELRASGAMGTIGKRTLAKNFSEAMQALPDGQIEIFGETIQLENGKECIKRKIDVVGVKVSCITIEHFLH